MSRSLVAAVLLGVVTANASARPSDGPERAAKLDDDGRTLTLSVDYPDLFDPVQARRLDSGFATHVVARAWLFRDGKGKPEALALRTFRVAYDLWDEVYLVEEHDESGTHTYREPKREGALRRITSLTRLSIAESGRVPEGVRHVVAVLVEVNPVSPELLAQVRRWLTRPPEAHRFTDAGESFFGSFVSIFLNPRVGDAERVLRFRTSPFFRPVRIQPAGKAARPPPGPVPSPAVGPALGPALGPKGEVGR